MIFLLRNLVGNLMQNEQIDVIVRFHDSRRLLELKRCVFSLVGQTHRPLNIILATQRFADWEIDAVQTALAPVLRLHDAPTMQIVNWDQAWPTDGRSALLNKGIQAASGRYLAFLDYDDVLYPEAYQTLVSQVLATNSGIAFASIRVLEAKLHDSFVEALGVIKPNFSGKSLLDLFRANFCPIHSYLIDKNATPSHVLFFDESLAWEEDYEFLLRVCATTRSDFIRIGKTIGDYFKKTDGSNTIHVGEFTPEQQKNYDELKAVIEARRKFIVVSPEVQSAMGLAGRRDDLTIQDVLLSVGQERPRRNP